METNKVIGLAWLSPRHIKNMSDDEILKLAEDMGLHDHNYDPDAEPHIRISQWLAKGLPKNENGADGAEFEDDIL